MRRRTSHAHAALLAAAERLLVRSPFETFSIDDVTREAGVARGSFYNHFATVDELIATTQRLVQEKFNDEVAAAIADSPDAATSMVRGMAVVMRFGYLNHANARLLLSPGPGAGDPGNPSNRELTRALQQGIDDGEFILATVEDGIVASRGIAEFGLARMIDIHQELSAVRALTTGMCTSMLRALGTAPDRIEPLVHDAVTRYFVVPS